MLERLVDFFQIRNQFLLVHRCDYTNLTVVIQGMINMTGKAPGLVVGSSGKLASQIAAFHTQKSRSVTRRTGTATVGGYKHSGRGR
jgi:hypothetical protein